MTSEFETMAVYISQCTKSPSHEGQDAKAVTKHVPTTSQNPSDGVTVIHAASSRQTSTPKPRRQRRILRHLHHAQRRGHPRGHCPNNQPTKKEPKP